MINAKLQKEYQATRKNGGFYRQKRGLIEVSGKEAIQFLNGLITNDVAKLEENAAMLAAFPNAQGRLVAVVRVKRMGDKFLFETEDATREKVFNNLFRFTFAGDFFVEDLSKNFQFFEVQSAKCKVQSLDLVEFETNFGTDYFVPQDSTGKFFDELKNQNLVEISDELYEVLRIENGIPKYAVDMDETTIVPELGIDDLISYNKGCYIGQEIIARIHFRGHVAKKLTGLVFDDANAAVTPNDEIKSLEGKNAGRVTSITFSPSLERKIALAFVRYDYLAEETELKVNDYAAKVRNLPFVD